MTSKDKRPLISPDTVMGSILLVLALVFPLLFHVVHLGSTFLPMFFPIALAGFLISPGIAALVGLMAPLLSSILTGMPPLYPPIAPLMAVEGLVLAAAIGLARKKFNWGVYPSLIVGIVLQRSVMAIAVFFVAPLFRLPGDIFTAGMLISGIPGIILQLIAIPPIVIGLEPRMKRLEDIA